MTVDLVPEWTVGSLSLTSYPYAVDADSSVEIGEPGMVVESIQSSLADGELERVTRHGNRTYVIPIYIEGPSLAELAESEAALRSELTKSNLLLSHNPGDGFSPTSVYEVQTAQLTPERDDQRESHLIRGFTLTFTCSPFARSASLTTVASLPTGGSFSQSVIDNCDSAAGWTGTRNGAAGDATTFWEAGAVGIAELDGDVTSPETWALKRTGSMSFATMPYLVAHVKHISRNSWALSVSAVTSAGATLGLPIMSRRSIGTDGYHEVVCLVPDGVTLASVTFTHTSAAGDHWQGLFVTQVSQTNMPPGSSARQLTRVLDVGGTERTPASLRAYTSSGFLGMTLMHTTPFDGSGYTPDQRRRRVSGNTTATNVDARKITGIWEPMQPNPVVSRTPAHSLPRGDYLLVAAIKSDTATTINPHPIDWAVKSVTSGQVAGQVGGRGYGWFPTPHELTIVPIASIAAPVVRSGALDVEVHLLNPTSTIVMDVEEWWLFKDDEDSALSIVNTAEGNLWLDSPDVESGVPMLWVGPEKPLAYHPAAGLVAAGLHTFKPGEVLVTSISDSNDYLRVELSYYEQWHSNAAR